MLKWCLLICSISLTTGGCMTSSETAPVQTSPSRADFRVWAVRYQVTDVDRAAAFYTGHLGFKLDFKQGPAIAKVSLGELAVLLSGPGSSGARPLLDGRPQAPGGWNRIVLRVKDLPARVAEMKAAGLRFRSDIEKGPGGQQIQLEDPDGNPIELFEPAAPTAT
jgi:glyoxylase I family protein